MKSIIIDKCPACGARDSLYRAIKAAIRVSLTPPYKTYCQDNQTKSSFPKSYIECYACNSRWVDETGLAKNAAMTAKAGQLLPLHMVKE